MNPKLSLFLLVTVLAINSVRSKTTLNANGGSDTYGHLDSVLGGSSTEVPDCGHNVKHITQGNDGTLNKQVFFFNAHKNSDDDRCINADRQRTEMKTNKGNLHGVHGETISYSWNFKLDAGFQPSSSFTHVHQLKAVGGNEKQPVVTITPRKGSPNIIEIIHISNSEVTTKWGHTNLAPFLGTWVHVQEEATYWSGGGRYHVRFSKVSDGSQIYALTKENVDMWRDGASYIRGKWGIYRSLNDAGSLRDETVRYDNFCFAKGDEKC